MYIPFKLLTKAYLDELSESENTYLVLQKFDWPNLQSIKGFILQPYKEIMLAQMHAIQRSEANCMIVTLPAERKYLVSLLEGKEQLIFLNELIEQSWQDKLARLYAAQIKRGIIEKQLFPILNIVEVKFQIELGKLLIVMYDGSTIEKAPFYDFVMGY
ncbi:hypothetical protein [Sphingobacterium siyangense]|uniref:hypothetical protein n=1 Tax=Sphingobacterium siyangense TaxID=459529 RepID=UPI002FDB8239